MSEDDAAVAKLDHYIIAISGALDRIGTKALVRITDVGRNVARAEIADDGPPKPKRQPSNGKANSAPKPAATQNGSSDQVESDPTRSPRRRGSRGGRGRSRAKKSAE
jgi:hypothetical protein